MACRLIAFYEWRRAHIAHDAGDRATCEACASRAVAAFDLMPIPYGIMRLPFRDGCRALGALEDRLRSAGARAARCGSPDLPPQPPRP